MELGICGDFSMALAGTASNKATLKPIKDNLFFILLFTFLLLRLLFFN